MKSRALMMMLCAGAAGLGAIPKEWVTVTNPLVRRGPESIIWSVAWSPKGDRVAALWEDGAFRVGDGKTLQWQVVEQYAVGFNALKWTSKRLLLASSPYADEAKNLQIWDALAGKRVSTLGSQLESGQRISWSPSGKRLASWSRQEQTVRCWDVESGKLLQTLRPSNLSIAAVDWRMDDRAVATLSAYGDLELWEVSGGNRMRVPQTPPPQGDFGYGMRALAWCPGGKYLASTGPVGLGVPVQVWDVTSGELVIVAPKEEVNVHAMAWSPDGSQFAYAGEEGVHIFRKGDWKRVYLLPSDCLVTSLAWRHDARRLLAGRADGTIAIWDLPKAPNRPAQRSRSSERRLNHENAEVTKQSETLLAAGERR
jgi:WD40 repeat protein